MRCIVDRILGAGEHVADRSMIALDMYLTNG